MKKYALRLSWLGLLPFMLASCGEPKLADAPEECLSQCELGASSCDELGFDEFPGSEATLSDWSASCDSELLFLAEGECDDGKTWLYQGTGHSTEVRYFDDDQQFLGLGTTTDSQLVGDSCDSASYWPGPIACLDATVTNVHCGDSYEVGDSPDLPWAEY